MGCGSGKCGASPPVPERPVDARRESRRQSKTARHSRSRYYSIGPSVYSYPLERTTGYIIANRERPRTMDVSIWARMNPEIIRPRSTIPELSESIATSDL